MRIRLTLEFYAQVPDDTNVSSLYVAIPPGSLHVVSMNDPNFEGYEIEDMYETVTVEQVENEDDHEED